MLMDIDDIRRTNIRALENEAGSPTAAADRVGMSYSQYLNYRNGAKEAKTGKLRGMRKETAWRFDDAFGKTRGWLDQPHETKLSLRAEEPAARYAIGAHHGRPLVRSLCELAEKINDAGLEALVAAAACFVRSHPRRPPRKKEAA